MQSLSCNPQRNIARVCLTNAAALHANCGLALEAADGKTAPAERNGGRDELAAVGLTNQDAGAPVARLGHSPVVVATAGDLHRNAALEAPAADAHPEVHHVLHDAFPAVAPRSVASHAHRANCKEGRCAELRSSRSEKSLQNELTLSMVGNLVFGHAMVPHWIVRYRASLDGSSYAPLGATRPHAACKGRPF